MAENLSGREARDSLKQKLMTRIASQTSAGLPKPALVIFEVGDRPDSAAYIRQKKMLGAELGIEVIHRHFPETCTEAELLSEITQANNNKSAHGILVQLPLPAHIDPARVISHINPKKDVDGLIEGSGFMPATARGVVSLLDFYSVPIKGKHVVVVGRSRLVGRPTALALLDRDATVSMAHKHTENLAGLTTTADILIVAIGDPEFIDAKHVASGQVVIDIGINEVTRNGKKVIVGDVNHAAVAPLVKALSPVPGGVGPMTVLSLFENTVDAYTIIENG